MYAGKSGGLRDGRKVMLTPNGLSVRSRNLPDLVPELGGGVVREGSHEADASCLGNRRGEFGLRQPHQPTLDDGIPDPEHLGDPGLEHLRHVGLSSNSGSSYQHTRLQRVSGPEGMPGPVLNRARSVRTPRIGLGQFRHIACLVALVPAGTGFERLGRRPSPAGVAARGGPRMPAAMASPGDE